MTTFEKVKRVIVDNFDQADAGLFFSRNTEGDSMSTLFEENEVIVDICYDYGYYEVFGLTESEKKELKDLYKKLKKGEMDMDMTIKEYAQVIANNLNATVRECEKANGVVYTGVTLVGETISPVVYVNSYFENKVPIDTATELVRTAIKLNKKDKPAFIEKLSDYEDFVKDRLQIRLYNESTNADVKKSASEYGFDDLILVPYINLKGEMDDGYIKVTEDLLAKWEVTNEEVINQAFDNLTYEMKNFMDIMPIITNEDNICGAAGVIKAHNELMKTYENGYVVIPSSIHEVIVMPYPDNESDLSAYTQMVKQVNASEVDADEVLSDHIYCFKA
jgi:hypothetical protein